MLTIAEINEGKGIGADLRYANLRGADLIVANLRSANLIYANLRSANLRSANLRSADLSGANLRNANLRSADLSGADLSGADLSEANLRSADLSEANLRSADLSDADLSDADLSDADLHSADLSGAIWTDGQFWETYLTKTVPALLIAGGKTLKKVLSTGCWECHTWDNCPMHSAFGISHPEEGPTLLIPRIKEFVQLFDAGLIPKPVIE